MNKQGNKLNPSGGIEWTHVFGLGTGYTANPVRGCKHDCKWRMPNGDIAGCYAKAVAEGIAKGAYPKGFEELQWHPEELSAIEKHKEPCGIFIDSMSDLFGAQVPKEWIDWVMDCIKRCPQHIFISLTKNPPRLQEIKLFPDNIWVGISAPPTFMFGKELTQDQQFAWLERGLKILDGLDVAVTWISIEPLSFDLSAHLVQFGKRLKWAVIGAASNGSKTFQPDQEDLTMAIYAMKGRPVFFKGNLSKELAQKVAGGWRAEFPEVPYAEPMERR